MRSLALLGLACSSLFAASAQDADKALFDPQVLSEDPAAKADWKLTRTAADVVDGPTPLILVHGLSTDFWKAFVAWASDSDEAIEFRAQFQLWKYLTPNEGVNAAVGYSDAYPGFDESLAAYLDRFIADAEQNGSEGTDGETYFFPQAPFCMLTHSQGGMTARAFLANFPDRAEQCLGVVTLSAPHTGSPGATPEWVRHTLARLGPLQQQILPQPLRGAFASYLLGSYLSTNRQSDMDMGWANFDGGIPTRTFRAWISQRGYEWRTVSARDASQTGARELPGIADNTFEPAQLLPNFCGGIDEVTPKKRGGLNMDKFFLYGAYVEPGNNFDELRAQAEHAYGGDDTGLYFNAALRLLSVIMAQCETNGSRAPLGTFLLNDGFVPLQSQLMLDGHEDTLIYKTCTIGGVKLPAHPFAPRLRLIRQHTLANPERLRILRGWSHYDTVTGRYDDTTQTSPLFPMIAQDLQSVLP
ncbi:MAG: alpha/beta hydrolase [Candidatus Hydrogenedentes bacterium]|nr:alpha/beta hydrolase [Candidatus Hydrogenedentota bacterium]